MIRTELLSAILAARPTAEDVVYIECHGDDYAKGDLPKSGDDYDPTVILDLDYWVLMPR